MSNSRIIHKIMLIYLLINAIFHGIIADDITIKYVPLLLAIYIMLTINKSWNRISQNNFLLWVVWGVYIILNICFAKYQNMLASRVVFYIITPLAIIYSVSKICLHKKIMLYDFILQRRQSVILNILCLINIGVIQIQLMGVPLFIKYDSTLFAYYDQINGIFGLNATPHWSIFVAFLLVYNFTQYIQTKNKVFIFVGLAEIVLSAIQSLFNDNKGFFIMLLLAFFIILRYYLCDRKYTIKEINKIILLALIASVILLGIMFVDTDITRFIRVNVIGYILMPFGYKGEIDLMHTNERWSTFMYALNELNGYGLGMGIGWNGKVTGIEHFGISELSLKTGYGGIIYYLLWVYTASMFTSEKKRTPPKYILVYWIIISSYTRVFTSYQASVLSSLFMVAVNYLIENNVSKKSN